MSDEDLINAALERTKGLKGEAREKALGVTRQHIDRWRKGHLPKLGLQPETRARLERLVASPEDRGPAYIDGYAAALDDVQRAVDALRTRAEGDVAAELAAADALKAADRSSPTRPVRRRGGGSGRRGASGA